MRAFGAGVLVSFLWVAGAAVCIGLGVLIQRLVLRGSCIGIRAAMWWGAAAALLLIMTINVVAPLNSMLARIVIGLLIAIGVAGLVSLQWHMPQTRFLWFSLVAVGVLLIPLGIAALGPVTNYDTGLYHLGAIGYAREYGTVPGIANIHDRFGFNSSLWPLAAAADALGAGRQGFRLVNGLVATFLLMEMLGRMRSARRDPGSILLYITGTLAFIGALQYTDRLIAGPSQDFAALPLFLVSSAYLLDALHSAHVGRNPWRLAGLALLLASLAATVRPLGWLVVLATVIVLIGVWLRRPHLRQARAASFVWPAIGSIALALLMSCRDLLMSGWLLFPLGLVSFPVDWRVPTTTSTREDITGWARTPFQDPAITLADSSWISGWLLRLPLDWGVLAAAVLLFLGLSLLSIALLVRPGLRGQVRRTMPVFIAAGIPSAIALLGWLLTAPDPRFVWGPLLVVASLPLVCWIDATHARFEVLGVAMVTMVVIAIASGWFRSDGFGLWTDKRQEASLIALPATPLPTMATESAALLDGTPALRTTGGDDRCWSSFPLCAPWYAPLAAERRGALLEAGFRPASSP